MFSSSILNIPAFLTASDFQSLSDAAVGFALFDKGAFVGFFLAATDADFHFDEATPSIEGKWDERQALSRAPADQTSQLPFMDEEEARSRRLIIRLVAFGFFIRGNVAIYQFELPILDAYISAFEVDAAELG